MNAKLMNFNLAKKNESSEEKLVTSILLNKIADNRWPRPEFFGGDYGYPMGTLNSQTHFKIGDASL